MVWGIISFEGVGPLQIVESRFNSANYVDILENHVVSFVGNGIFMHDNAPIHTARLCKDFLRNQAITTLDWPPCSPDINPIENVWGYMKAKINSLTNPPKTGAELRIEIQRQWNSVPVFILHNLYRSMFRRIQKVLRSSGSSCFY